MFNIDDPKRMAMLQAGLGMMANSSGPNSGNAFGLGLQQGVQSYQNSLAQKKQEDLLKKEQEMRQRQFEQQQLLRQMQIDDIVKKQQAEAAQKSALQYIFTPRAGLPGKGGQVDQQAYAPPETLDGVYSEMMKYPELAMDALKGRQAIATRADNTPKEVAKFKFGQELKAKSPELYNSWVQQLKLSKPVDIGDAYVDWYSGKALGKNLAPNQKIDYIKDAETTKETVKQDAERMASAEEAASMAAEAQFYTDGIRDLLPNMDDGHFGFVDQNKTKFDPYSNRASKKLKNLIGNVRKKLGNGVLTDEDFLQLEAMLPSLADTDKATFEANLADFERELAVKIAKHKGLAAGRPDPLGLGL